MSLAFGGVRAVTDVAFTACSGQITSLIGPNGAGKTTVLNVLSGLLPRTSAALRWGSSRCWAGDHVIARLGMARTYQTSHCSRLIRVSTNRHATRQVRDTSDHASRCPTRGRLQLSSGLLASWATMERWSVRLEDSPTSTSGSWRSPVPWQRNRRCSSSMSRPPAWTQATSSVWDSCYGQVADADIAVVLVEHHMPLVMSLSDHVVVLNAGRVIAAGSPAQVRQDEAVRKAYLGDRTHRELARPATERTHQACVLAVQQLSAGYGAAPVLEGVDLQCTGNWSPFWEPMVLGSRL